MMDSALGGEIAVAVSLVVCEAILCCGSLRFWVLVWEVICGSSGELRQSAEYWWTFPHSSSDAVCCVDTRDHLPWLSGMIGYWLLSVPVLSATFYCLVFVWIAPFPLHREEGVVWHFCHSSATVWPALWFFWRQHPWWFLVWAIWWQQGYQFLCTGQGIAGQVNCRVRRLVCFASWVGLSRNLHRRVMSSWSVTWRYWQRFKLFHCFVGILGNWLCDRIHIACRSFRTVWSWREVHYLSGNCLVCRV